MELGSVENTLHIVLDELGMAAMANGLHLEVLFQNSPKKYQNTALEA